MKVQNFMAIQPIAHVALMLAVFKAKVFGSLKTHQHNWHQCKNIPALRLSEWNKQWQENHRAQPFHGPSVLYLRLCEAAVRFGDGLDRDSQLLFTTLLSTSHRWLQAWVKPAHFLLCRSRGRVFQMNIWAEWMSHCWQTYWQQKTRLWCVTVKELITYWHNLI